MIIDNIFQMDMLFNGYIKDDNTGYLLSNDRDKLLYCNEESNVSIPTQILELAGFSCVYAKTITLNKNLKKIGNVAFLQLEMEYLILNDGLQVIGKTAFASCSNLQNVVIPSSVYFIGSEAFHYGNIYCNVETRPKDWHEDFASGSAKVYWLGEWEFDEQGNPVPIITSANN